mmetsp:Transcript_8169/g.17631  ORF Transcript_8169/g.17631 Transcript_8169/m.17631 type:complete len:85 (+) Transcript_8169:906-1160(+)
MLNTGKNIVDLVRNCVFQTINKYIDRLKFSKLPTYIASLFDSNKSLNEVSKSQGLLDLPTSYCIRDRDLFPKDIGTLLEMERQL